MNFLNHIAKITAKIEANELRAVMLSFSFVFTILASYYILRPVRDAMSSDWSDAQLSTIWTFTFLISFFVVSLYGYACSKIKFKHLVPSIYGIFALTFYFLFLLTNFFPGLNLINQIFYVWVSVFSLLNISVFWSFMADTYNKEQAKRLFGFIAAGSSLGAFCGPLITILFARTVGSNGLILISATMLFIPVLIAIYLQRIKETDLQNTATSQFNEQPMGAKIFSLDYRLAPENKFPSSLQDANLALEWLAKKLDLCFCITTIQSELEHLTDTVLSTYHDFVKIA